MQVADIIREIMEAKNLNQVRLSKLIRVSQGTVSKWMSGQQGPRLEEWARVLRLIEGDATLKHLRYTADGSSAAIMGRVGAGSIIEPDIEQVPPEGLDSYTLPFPVPAEMIGFIVDGDSMYPKYEPGDIIVVYKDQRQAMTAYIGQNVVVRTEDGRRYLKRIFAGSKPDLYRLESFNAAPIHDVSIAWIGEIYATVPAGQVFRVPAKTPPAKAPRHRGATK
jgi:repressor LexA